MDMKPAFRTRLGDEPIGWMTTVNASGVPSTNPVWFLLRDDGTIIVHSKDPSVRVRNLGVNPHVTLHLEGNGRGGDILVCNGVARIDREEPNAAHDIPFLDKYRSFLERNRWTPQWFADHYPTPIVMEISSIRGW
jgi:PPOX class probable F420-dependent enzyme